LTSSDGIAFIIDDISKIGKIKDLGYIHYDSGITEGLNQMVIKGTFIETDQAFSELIGAKG
jgi:hypothetical protein